MIAGCLCGLRLKVKQLVDSEYFQRGILFAILINTLSMGIEYHNQVKHCLMSCFLQRFVLHWHLLVEWMW